MDDFKDWFRQCIRRAELPQTWGRVVNGMTLILGWILAVLIYKNPHWTGSIQAWYGVLCVIVLPLGAASAVMLYRVLMSPFWVYRETVAEHAATVVLLQGEIETRNSVLDTRAKRKEVRDRLGGFLTALNKTIRNCKDVNQGLPIETANKLYAEISTYIRENLGNAERHRFISNTVVPDKTTDSLSLLFTSAGGYDDELPNRSKRSYLLKMLESYAANLDQILKEIPRDI